MKNEKVRRQRENKKEKIIFSVLDSEVEVASTSNCGKFYTPT
jgi:hypothetical protein